MVKLVVGAAALAALFGFFQVALAVWAVVVASISRRNVHFFGSNGYLPPDSQRSWAKMTFIGVLAIINPFTWLVLPNTWSDLPALFQAGVVVGAGAIVISAVVCLGECRLPTRGDRGQAQTLGPATAALFEVQGADDIHPGV